MNVQQYEVIYSDRKDKLWINGPDGSSIARFNNRAGMDIHNSASDQMAGKPECLHCTHGKPTLEDWQEFRAEVEQHWGIKIPEDAIKILGEQ